MNATAIALLLGAAASALPVAAAQVCHAASDARLIPLVELYTSEGCSSCPPAERWLSTNFAPEASHATALAFHVDYWDRLGWRDRFAQPAFAERQYAAMRANRGTFVFTPQVLLQGRDHPGWRGADAAAALAAAGRRAPGATIAVAAEPDGDSVALQATVRLTAQAAHGTVLAIVYVDSGLASEVTAGENRGERLRHDHVVRGLEKHRLVDTVTTLHTRLARPHERGFRPRIVAFVQRESTGDVLQTLALPLDGCR